MALALACFFATWAVFGLRYELNDDAQLANIAMGAYGEDTHHLVYVNVLLGWFLKPFYALAANVNWYYFLQVAANVAAFGMLGTLCMERLGTRRGLLLYGGVLLAFGVDMFNSFQYTKNSALYLTVGLALLASELGVWSLRTGAGLFWAVLGSMVRFQNFFAVALSLPGKKGPPARFGRGGGPVCAGGGGQSRGPGGLFHRRLAQFYRIQCCAHRVFRF